jgi:hypothetical protein
MKRSQWSQPCTPEGVSFPPQQDHVFVPSGENKRYLCALHGCRSRGMHEACVTCGWPADEHPVSLGKRAKETQAHA